MSLQGQDLHPGPTCNLGEDNGRRQCRGLEWHLGVLSGLEQYWVRGIVQEWTGVKNCSIGGYAGSEWYWGTELHWNGGG